MTSENSSHTSNREIKKDNEINSSGSSSGSTKTPTLVVSILGKVLEYAKLVLPHVGLVILCILYVLAGGVIFFLIERSNESQVRAAAMAAIHQSRSEALDNLWSLTKLDDMNFETYRNSAMLEIEEYSKVLFEEFEDRYISLENIRNNNTDNMWSVTSAMFFAIATVTTIGYGNLVPVTMQGRILCTIFGLFGIPLMLVTIANVGSFLGDTLKMLAVKYKSCDEKGCCKKSVPVKKAEIEIQIEGAADDSENLKEEDEDEDLNLEISDEVDVPVTWILMLIMFYTLLGALLFPQWESWSFFESFYFCFITMTTIGFGDYVPTNKDYYIITVIYIVLGLAITTMSIDLAAGQYIKKIHFFGRKIQSAKEALKNVSDIMKYSMFLKRRYGLSDKQMEKMAFLPEFFAMQELLLRSGAYTPADINRFLYIDQRTESLLTESQRSSVRTLEESMLRKILDQEAERDSRRSRAPTMEQGSTRSSKIDKVEKRVIL